MLYVQHYLIAGASSIEGRAGVARATPQFVQFDLPVQLSCHIPLSKFTCCCFMLLVVLQQYWDQRQVFPVDVYMVRGLLGLVFP